MRYIPISEKNRKYMDDTGKTPSNVAAMVEGCSVGSTRRQDNKYKYLGPNRVKNETPQAIEFVRSAAEAYAYQVEKNYKMTLEIFGEERAYEAYAEDMGRGDGTEGSTVCTPPQPPARYDSKEEYFGSLGISEEKVRQMEIRDAKAEALEESRKMRAVALSIAFQGLFD